MGKPGEHPELYERASPVLRADRLSRPILILHGTADTDAPLLESIRLLDALLKGAKPVEFILYPGEIHGFRREHVMRDAWTRVAAFCHRTTSQAVIANSTKTMRSLVSFLASVSSFVCFEAPEFGAADRRGTA